MSIVCLVGTMSTCSQAYRFDSWPVWFPIATYSVCHFNLPYPPSHPQTQIDIFALRWTCYLGLRRFRRAVLWRLCKPFNRMSKHGHTSWSAPMLSLISTWGCTAWEWGTVKSWIVWFSSLWNFGVNTQVKVHLFNYAAPSLCAIWSDGVHFENHRSSFHGRTKGFHRASFDTHLQLQAWYTVHGWAQCPQNVAWRWSVCWSHCATLLRPQNKMWCLVEIQLAF